MVIKVARIRDMESEIRDGYIESRQLIKIDRTTPYGNPFILGRDGGRDAVIRLFTERILDGLMSSNDGVNLRDAVFSNYEQGLTTYLGCHCSPLACHGDVIREHLIEWFSDIISFSDNLDNLNN